MTKQIGDNAEATQTLQTEFKEVQGKIESKVWQSDITEAVTPLGSSITELSDKYTSQQQTIEGITTEIGDVQTSLESKADGSTVQALTGRVNKVEETATGFSRTISEIKTEVQGSVTDVAVFYAINESETVPPADDDPGWSLEAPEWTEGMFMWQKTVTTYASGASRSDIELTSWYEATALAFEKANSPKSDEMILTVHRWFANKSCPGNWMYARMGDLANRVTAQLGTSSDTPVKTSGTQAKVLAGLSEGDAIKTVGALFTADMNKSGILASVSLAQFILESGYGKSELAQNANNVFGMKKSLSGNTWSGSSWDGNSVYTKKTQEDNGSGKLYTITADFRKYPCMILPISESSHTEAKGIMIYRSYGTGLLSGLL